MTRFPSAAIVISAASVAALALAACSREAGTPPEPVDEAGVAEAPPAPQVDYACESGRAVGVRYLGADTAEVIYQQRTYTLRIARAASGARYTGSDLEWWAASRDGQEVATLSRLGPDEAVGSVVLERCTRPASTVSPVPPPGPGDLGPPDPGVAPDPDAAPACRGPALRLSREGGDAGAGSRVLVMALTNIGSAPCRMAGYPGIRLQTAEGAPLDQVRTAPRAPADLAPGTTPRPVTLAPGGKAWFDIGYSALPHEDLGETTCPSAARIVATAPGDTAAVPLDLAIQPCGGRIQVSPLRPTAEATPLE